MAPEIRVNSSGIPYIVEFANVSFRSHSQKSVPQTRPVLRPAATSIPNFVPKASFHSGLAVDERPTTPSTLGASPSKQARGPQRSLLRSLSLPFHAVQLRLPRRLRRKTSIDSDWTLAGLSAASSQETLAAPPPPPKDEFYLHSSSVRGSQSSYDTPSQYSQDSGVEVDNRRSRISNVAKGEGLLIRPTFSAAGVYPRGHPYRRLKPQQLVHLQFRSQITAAGMRPSRSTKPIDPSLQAAVDLEHSQRESTTSFGSASAEELARTGFPGRLYGGTYGQFEVALAQAGLTAEPYCKSEVPGAEIFGTLFVVRKTDAVNLELVKLVLYA